MAIAAPGPILDQTHLSHRFRPQAHVVWVRDADTTVVLDAEGGTYYTLNEIGGRIWELLAAGEPLLEVLQVLTGEYAVDRALLETDVVMLIAKLRAAGLIDRVAS